MGTSEKYISEALLKNEPKKPLGFVIKDDAVTTEKIKDQAVTEDKLADNSVSSDKILDGAVTKEKLGSLSISGDMLQDGSITRDKLGSDVIRILSEMNEHIYPRVLKTEDELNEMIENGGPFEEGTDYLAYEDNG